MCAVAAVFILPEATTAAAKAMRIPWVTGSGPISVTGSVPVLRLSLPVTA